jgi:ABC-type uncharacterized transport system permease subunit
MATGEIVLYVLTATAYAALGVHFWRTRWGATPGAEQLSRGERFAIMLPLAAQSALLYDAVFGQAGLRFGFGHALSATLWLAVLFYWLANNFYGLAGMLALVLPAAAVSVVLPAVFPGMETPPYTQSVEFRIHLALAMLAYGLFTIAALHAMLMAMVERRLHRARQSGSGGLGREALTGPLSALPPLLTLEALLFRILALGFVMLTLTLVTGVVFSEEVFGQPLQLNHKTLFGILSWLVFGGLLLGRWLWGWRGRRALRWTMTGFVVLLLAYVGSRFVLEVLLSRGAG